MGAVNYKLVCHSVWKRTQLNGQLNIFNDRTEYIDKTVKMHQTRENVFGRQSLCEISSVGKRSFFKYCILLTRTFPRYLQEGCNATGGISYFREPFTVNCLRNTAVALFFRGRSQRTGYCDENRSIETQSLL